MVEPQVGVSVNSTPMYGYLPHRSWQGPIKFEDKESWTMTQGNIVRGMVVLTRVKQWSSVPLVELVKRLNDELKIEKDFLMETVPRLLRLPVENGMVRGMEFRK